MNDAKVLHMGGRGKRQVYVTFLKTSWDERFETQNKMLHNIRGGGTGQELRVTKA